MKKGQSESHSFLHSLSEIIFFIIFLSINSVILIGEFTKKILSLPISLIKFLAYLSSFFLKGAVKRFKLPFFRFKKPLIKFPNLTVFLYERFRFLKNFFLKLKYFTLGSLLTLIFIFIFQSYNFVKSLPSPNNIGKVNFSLSTHLYDRNGKLLYEIYRDQNRTPVAIKDLPAYVYQATVAIEDKDFYKHKGISIIGGILRALKEDLLNQGLQGGSTITQQLVKSALLTPERTITRKIKEIILAVWAERIFSKEKILEMYLNQVAYGGSSYGIEEAAKTYFGKHAKELTLSQAAFLAGLPQAPSQYSPFTNPQLALNRRNQVLKMMYEEKYISKDQMLKSQREPLGVIPIKTKISAPHFVFYVKSNLEDLYGIKEVEEGGLKVITTVDLEIQNEAEKILREELEKIKLLNVTNGAILVTRPQTGEILAMVGSADYFANPSGAFNVTTAVRQPGSAIKPIMYSTALERGYTSASIIEDSPVVFQTQGQQPYRPVNYDGRFHGRVTLRLALANSLNVPAVKVLNIIGIEPFVNQAKKMGITTWTDHSRFGLSLTLGGVEVKMTDMAVAYGVLANLGYRVNLTYLLNLKDFNENKLDLPEQARIKVLNEGIAYIISDILADNFARQLEFGPNSALEIPGYKIAVKTGTTDQKKDNWAIGYTPEFLVAVWVGNNDNTPMNQQLTSGITGAAPIWNRLMSYLLKNYGQGKIWFERPDNVVEKVCYFGRKEYFIAGTEKTVSCKNPLFNQTPTPFP